jgi:hypothetical protein
LEGGPPGFLQDFTCPAVLGWSYTESTEVLRTGLLPAMAGFSKTVLLPRRFVTPPQDCGPEMMTPATPHAATPAGYTRTWVWAMSRSLATTRDISVDFSSSGYLDVSVPQVTSSYPMCSGMGD